VQKQLLAASLAALAILGACQKTGDGEYQVKTPEVNVSSDTHTVRTPTVDVGTKTESVTTPVVGTKPETLIVQKPVVGGKQTEVKVPTVDVKGPNERKRP
jgi:hypothetical protein